MSKNPPELWLWLQDYGYSITVEMIDDANWTASIEAKNHEVFEADGHTPLQALVKAWQRLRSPTEPAPRHPVVCPDCGPVDVRPIAWDNGTPVAGKCPKCHATLYFYPPVKPLYTPGEK